MKMLIWGCGNMARAMALGLKTSDPQIEFLCWNPTMSKAQELSRELDGSVWQCGDEFDAVMLGFKPQKLTEGLTLLKSHLKADTVLISLLAATQMKKFLTATPCQQVVRLMPNLGVASGDGVVLWGQQGLSPAEIGLWQKRLNGLGLAPLMTEEHIDLYTLHSGCAPAYLYQWIHDAGEFAAQNGGDPELARKILIEAFKGTLKKLDAKEDMLTKISHVASKGGVTEAVLTTWKKICGDYIKQGLSAGLAKMKEFRES